MEYYAAYINEALAPSLLSWFDRFLKAYCKMISYNEIVKKYILYIPRKNVEG